jgi:hypothetical protein
VGGGGQQQHQQGYAASSSDDAPEAASYAQSFLQNPYYFMFASLARPDDDNELHWLKVCVRPFLLSLFSIRPCGVFGRCLWFDGGVGVDCGC